MANLVLLFVSGLISSFCFFNEYMRYSTVPISVSQGSDYPFNNLSTELQSWYSRGSIISVNNIKMFYIYEKSSQPHSNITLIFIHGFPTSSYDYHNALERIKSVGYSVLVFDHVGFGFSDKPTDGFSYSIMEHADQAITLWQMLNISKAVLVAHDMGDTILTEILARRERNILPSHFNKFFAGGVIFTNGGMLLEHVSFRLSQILLLHPVLGPVTANIMNCDAMRPFADWFSHRQLASIWSPTASINDRDDEIHHIQQLNRYNRGNSLLHKTIHYLTDRYRFEPRYLGAVKSLSKSNISCSLIWGDKDAVSPPQLMSSLSKILTNCDAEFLSDVGHFPMLEDTVKWTDAIIKHVKKKITARH